MPLVHECGYEFDIKTGKDLIATSLLGMGIMCNTICAEVLQTLVDKRLLDTQDVAYLVHTESLLKKKGWNVSLEVMRNSV